MVSVVSTVSARARPHTGGEEGRGGGWGDERVNEGMSEGMSEGENE